MNKLPIHELLNVLTVRTATPYERQAAEEIRQLQSQLKAAQELRTQQLTAINMAAGGHWTSNEPIHPDYLTAPLLQIVELYAKYRKLADNADALANQTDQRIADELTRIADTMGFDIETPNGIVDLVREYTRVSQNSIKTETQETRYGELHTNEPGNVHFTAHKAVNAGLTEEQVGNIDGPRHQMRAPRNVFERLYPNEPYIETFTANPLIKGEGGHPTTVEKRSAAEEAAPYAGTGIQDKDIESTIQWLGIERPGAGMVMKALAEERDRYRKLYQELLYAVESKHRGETRHQTALRYLRLAQIASCAQNSEQVQKPVAGQNPPISL